MMKTWSGFSGWLMIIFLLASCQQEEGLIPSENDTTKETKKVMVNRQVSVEQAKAFAGMMANNLFSTTDGPKVRSATADEVREIEAIYPIVTDEQDTVMYAVNFGKDLGFMLLSGDKGTFPILAFNDSGNFSDENVKDNEALESWLEAKSELLRQRLQEPIDTTDNNLQLWENLVVTDSGEISIELVEYINETEPQTRADRRRYSRNLPAVFPMTGAFVKWGQGEGYNADAPGKNFKVGCPAVAVGMLCFSNWYPGKYYYMGMPYELKNVTQSNPISKMFRDIADNIPDYHWGEKSSGANRYDILAGLRNIGYKNAMLKDYDFDELYSNLRQGHAVLLRGFKPKQGEGGHVWMCDGYKEMKWHVTKYKKRFLRKKKKVAEWDEYADYIFMNWGWNGSSNAYYDESDWKAQNGNNYNRTRQMFVDLYPAHDDMR